MGFFDKIMDAAGGLIGENNEAGEKASGQKKSLVDGLGDLFKGGSLSGIVDNFTKKGLGDTISSWIGKGSNMPISIDQLKEGLGADKIQEFARKAGIPLEKAENMLKDFLPNIIDKITPNGKVEDDD